MKKILKNILSLEVMIVLLLFLAFSCAIATFIENDFGPLGAKSFIYGTTWFESIMLILTLCVLANIVWFKMYKKDKFFIFMIHISFVFLLIGSGLTRYAGFEAIMTIPEGSMQNRMLSNDEYLQVKISKDDFTKEYSKKVLITPLSQTKIDEKIDFNNEEITIKFNKFVPNAQEKIVKDKNKNAIINLIVTKFDGADTYDLYDKTSIDTSLVTFTLNKDVIANKALVNFRSFENKIYLKSNLAISYSNLEGKQIGIIQTNEEKLLKPYYIYAIAQTRFLTPEFSSSGKIDTVSMPIEEINKEKALNALVLDLTYKNETKTISLFGKGGANQGYKKSIKFKDLDLELSWGSKIMTLPFSILLDDFELQRYPGSNAPSSYSSKIKVYDKSLDEPLSYEIYMNNTMDHKGYRFFQSSYTQDESATILSVNKDPGKLPTYIGYFLLFTGLILNLFSKKGRFYKLTKTKYTIEEVKRKYLLKNVMILFALIFIFEVNLEASNLEKIKNINLSHANAFGSTLIQDYQGRIKPINSLAIEILNKISRTNTMYDLNENQIFLSMILYPEIWQELKFIKISNDKLKNILHLKKEDKYLSFSDIYDVNNKYILEDYLEDSNAKKSSIRDNFDKDLIKVDERLNIAYRVFTGSFLKLFPKINDINNSWHNLPSLLSFQDSSNEIKEIKKLTKDYFDSLELSIKTADWRSSNKALEEIKKYQEKYAYDIIPSNKEIKAELLFNKYDIFNKLTLYYLSLGLLLLIFVFINIFNPKTNLKHITTFVFAFIFLGFLSQTFALALRWYISGHAPWSNAYESLIYISWAIILSGMLFAKESKLALATTGVLSGITLFVAHLSWLEPQITTLVPVLKSYWLTIHVSVITASYGFLGLSAIFGFITLILMTFVNIKNENDRFFSILTSIKETRRVNEMSMFIGLTLLIIGNFLGGIWANESWGRYWGWDPKETWTLVSILIYAVILHLHYIKSLASNYIFATLSMISYSSIIMTYFGVNYYLAGMHSYAAGDPIPIPSFVPIGITLMFVAIALAFRNRKVV